LLLDLRVVQLQPLPSNSICQGRPRERERRGREEDNKGGRERWKERQGDRERKERKITRE
jgi:hypothetical protein